MHNKFLNPSGFSRKNNYKISYAQPATPAELQLLQTFNTFSVMSPARDLVDTNFEGVSP